jgi:hypothetical protein
MPDIGGTVHDDKVEAKHVAGLVHLLALLVDLEKQHEKGKITYHHVMPKNLVKFASEGRVHAGERLCKRAVRHAMDPATPGIIGATLVLGKCNGETCTTIVRQVRASMKKCLSKVTSAFLADHFLVTSCNCKAGCKNERIERLGEERILCTHGLTLPEQLGLLVCSDLAEHVLIELRVPLLSEDIERNLSKHW